MTDDKPTRRGRPPKAEKLTEAEKKARYRERQTEKLAQGADALIQVNVTVPASRAQDVRDFAARLRAEAKAANNKD